MICYVVTSAVHVVRIVVVFLSIDVIVVRVVLTVICVVFSEGIVVII